jgi:hypothetical protein
MERDKFEIFLTQAISALQVARLIQEDIKLQLLALDRAPC